MAVEHPTYSQVPLLAPWSQGAQGKGYVFYQKPTQLQQLVKKDLSLELTAPAGFQACTERVASELPGAMEEWLKLISTQGQTQMLLLLTSLDAPFGGEGEVCKRSTD